MNFYQKIKLSLNEFLSKKKIKYFLFFKHHKNN
jgi:hypothetical protein